MPYAAARVGRADRWLFRLALLTTVATFPLIFLGGIVTSHHAGMAVPDWPNSYGYNMFLFPPRYWTGGILYEHVHRLAGSAVGMLSVALFVAAMVTRPRRPIRLLCGLVLAGVIAQGVLGGLRVIWNDLDLAIVHACVAQAFFCLAGLTALVTSSWWWRPADAAVTISPKLVRVAIITVGIIYLQLILGALMRHFGAGLAITDFPFVYRQLLPPVTDAGLAKINHMRDLASNFRLEHVTLGQMWLHFAHRIGAVLVAGSVIHVVIEARHHVGSSAIRGLAWLLLVLTTLQITVGAMVVLLGKPADVATGHVALGALTLLAAFLLAVVTLHLRAKS